MNLKFFLCILCTKLLFGSGEESVEEIRILKKNGNYSKSLERFQISDYSSHTVDSGKKLSENSEFPPSIFTKEQLKNGAIILYFFGALYSFGVIGIVCGDYFLPSVDCICTDLNLSQDVAAATFMSFATTAPELFIILIATFITKSDIGVGAVVGSGMFNILGVATIGGLAAKAPIKLDWWPLYRDSIVYMFAPIGLALILYDGEVTMMEALGLTVYYFFYFFIMLFNRRIRSWIKGKIKKLKKQKESLNTKPTSVPTISLTFDDTQNVKVFPQESAKEEDHDDVSFKAFFMNYEDSISLRRASACSSASSRSNRSRRKSDRSLKNSAQNQTSVKQTKLGDNLQFITPSLQDLNKKKTEDANVSPEAETAPEDADQSIQMSFCTFPTGSYWDKFTWVLLWPSSFVLFYTIPDCRSEKWRRFYPLTFLMCVFWIGISSYFGTWMISVVGQTIGISESVMGLTFLALGGSMPEAISTFIMSRQGEGGLGFSNSLGGNTMDICLCLGLPWLIKSIMEGTVYIKSEGLAYNSTALVIGVIVLLSISTYTKFHMNQKMGFVCCVFYFIFIIISVLIEMNVIDVNSDS